MRKVDTIAVIFQESPALCVDSLLLSEAVFRRVDPFSVQVKEASAEKLNDALAYAFSYASADSILIEEFIPGRPR